MFLIFEASLTLHHMTAIASINSNLTESTVLSVSLPDSLATENLDILKVSVQSFGNKMQGMCRFEQGFEPLLPLFRGLILLGKPKTLSLIYDFPNSQVYFSYSLGERVEVEQFLNQVIRMLKSEVRFKRILRQIITSKRRFQSEQALIQSALHQPTWD